MKKITVKHIKSKKGWGKISMLTCYDYSFAGILDSSGVDIILVGDSLANVVLGLDKTNTVSVAEMLNHTQAVAKAVKHSLVVTDMPYLAYQKEPAKALSFAKKFILKGAEAVKIEWFSQCKSVIKRLVKNNIPVMGHIGLTPQTAHLLGGYKVQGRSPEAAKKLIDQAKIIEDLGAFSLVLECLPYQLSQRISKAVRIPTIGIGAGKYCDGQVLVSYDFLGLYSKKKLKFTRVYCDLSSQIKTATKLFIKDVKKGKFPSQSESF